MNSFTQAIDSVAGIWSDEEAYYASAKSTGEALCSERLLALRVSSPPWLKESLEHLHGLLDLPTNWDSYGACSVDPSSVDCARQVVQFLAKIDTIERPLISATPAGNAALCWNDCQRTLEVEILPDGSLEYVYLSGTDGMPDEEGQLQLRERDLEWLAILLTQF